MNRFRVKDSGDVGRRLESMGYGLAFDHCRDGSVAVVACSPDGVIFAASSDDGPSAMFDVAALIWKSEAGVESVF